MSTRIRRRDLLLNMIGIFVSGMALSVSLVPVVAHGPTVFGIVRVLFPIFYAFWLGSDIIKEVRREQD